jgi:hypothetical protein
MEHPLLPIRWETRELIGPERGQFNSIQDSMARFRSFGDDLSKWGDVLEEA